MDLETQKQYDRIIAMVLSKILALSSENNNAEIVLKNFNPNNIKHKFFFHVAYIGANITNKKISIETSFLKYLKFKIINRKKKIKLDRKSKSGIDIEDILCETIEYFDVSEDIYKDIYEEYYE